MGNRTPISQKLDHPRLGPVSILQVDNQPFIQYIVSVHHEQAQKTWEDALKDIRGKKQFECMFLPQSFEVEKVPCGISRNLKAIYPYFPFSLKSEIANRVGLNSPFEEKELQYLLFELLDLCKEFEKLGQKAGNIKPDNILINNDGEVSIICRHSYPGFVEGYAAALYDKQPSFLCKCVYKIAPEQMKQLETSNEQSNVDVNKAQAFSIGMTILSAGLLDTLQSLYNFKNGKFDQKLLQQTLITWKQNGKYSGFFKLVVQRLLALDPQQRVSPGEMRAYLSPYEQNIRILEPYQPNYQLSENNLYQYRQAKLNKKNTKEEGGEPPKGIRQLGAKFAKTSSNRDSAQLNRAGTKIIPIGADRPYISNIDPTKVTRDPAIIYSTTSQPVGQYVLYKPSPIITYTSGAPTNFTTAPVNFSYTTSAPTHYPYVYTQQPSQSLASTAFKPVDVTASSTAQKEAATNVQEMLKEFKAELSAQKTEKSSQTSVYASPEPNHNGSNEEK